MTVARAFLWRDCLLWLSYRMALLWHLIGIVVILSLTYFVGRAIGIGGTGLGPGAGYSAFVLAGVAFTDTFMVGMTGLPQSLREAQLSGTLEPMLLTPVPAGYLIAAPFLWRLLQSLIRLFALLAVAVLLLQYWPRPNAAAVLMVLVGGCCVFLALGFLSSAFVLLFKQGDPVILGYVALSGILGGTLFPTSLLPSWLQPMVNLLPLSHALSGVRRALDGSSLADVLPETAGLLLLAAFLIPVALLAFNLALSRAKREGSLAQY